MARHWTDKTDAEADVYFATLSDAEIRRRQDLCNQQIKIAYERRLTDALADLQRMDCALARAMFVRLTPALKYPGHYLTEAE